jgi:hypothetical protein
MGFYCYTCQKMRYKGQYHPSEILCPVTNNFVDLDCNLDKVKHNKYIQLSNETPNDELVKSTSELHNIINNLTIEYQSKIFNLLHFIESFIAKKYHNQVIKNVEDFVKTVGKININNFKFIID